MLGFQHLFLLTLLDTLIGESDRACVSSMTPCFCSRFLYFPHLSISICPSKCFLFQRVTLHLCVFCVNKQLKLKLSLPLERDSQRCEVNCHRHFLQLLLLKKGNKWFIALLFMGSHHIGRKESHFSPQGA